VTRSRKPALQRDEEWLYFLLVFLLCALLLAAWTELTGAFPPLAIVLAIGLVAALVALVLVPD